MKKIISRLFKKASLPSDIRLSLSSNEAQIFEFLRAVNKDISDVIGHGITARVCGGWVRDKLLGKQSKDIDINIEGMKGDTYAYYLHQMAQQRYGASQKVVSRVKTTEERPEQIKNLSVAFLKIFGQEIEILPLRGKEVYREGDRNPISTESATPEEDAHRRDLTINALFYNINTGLVEDFTGQGYDDLMTMTLRTPARPGHDPVEEATRILYEDPVRLLRIMRFHSKYKRSKIAPEVVEAMGNPNVHHQIVRRLYGDKSGGIVPERTADELRKIMVGEQPDKAVGMMLQTGLLQKMLLLPENYHPLEMDQKNRHHGLTLINHTIQVLKNVNELSQEFGLSDKERMMMNFTSLFHDIGKLDPRSHKEKPDGSRGYAGSQGPDSVTHQQASQERWDVFAKALKLSDEESSWISNAVLNHMNPHAHVEGTEEGAVPSDKQLRRYIRKNPSWVFQYIHAMADAMSKDEMADPSATNPYRENLDRIRTLAPDASEFGNLPPAQDLLRGPEIMNIVGLNPKPPEGLTGYIEVIKELIREQQDANPLFSPQSATMLVQNLSFQGRSGQGPLAPYFQNAV